MGLCWMRSAADSSGILAEQQGDVAAAVMNGSVLGSAVDQSLLHVTTVGERACVCARVVYRNELNLWSAACSQSETDIVTELESKCVE